MISAKSPPAERLYGYNWLFTIICTQQYYPLLQQLYSRGRGIENKDSNNAGSNNDDHDDDDYYDNNDDEKEDDEELRVGVSGSILVK